MQKEIDVIVDFNYNISFAKPMFTVNQYSIVHTQTESKKASTENDDYKQKQLNDISIQTNMI